MPRYVDGFLIPIPKKNLAAYRRLAAATGAIWKSHGALDYVEAVGDDLLVKGMVSTFPKVTLLKRGETVCFAFITFKSRRHRDAVNKKVLADPRLHALCTPDAMPFDFRRMNYGGFTALVDL